MSSARTDDPAARQGGSRDDALRRDVRLVGDALGRVLVEQDGEELLADVERVRRLAREARASGSPADQAALAAFVRSLDDERSTAVLRAFGLYFQLANVAEAYHRVRSRRRYEREERIPRESLAEAFGRLAERGVGPDELTSGARGRLARARHHGASDRGRPPHGAAGPAAAQPHPRGARRSRARPRGATRARGRRDRRDHGALAGRRGALAPAARRRRDPPRPLVLRDDAARRRSGRARRVPRVAPRRTRPAALRLLGRRRPGRQSRGGAAHGRGVARARAHARPDALPQRGARARARDRRLHAHGAGLRRAVALDRRGRARAGRLRRVDRRPELRRAVSPQAELRRQAPRESARSAPRSRATRTPMRCSPIWS